MEVGGGEGAGGGRQQEEEVEDTGKQAEGVLLLEF